MIRKIAFLGLSAAALSLSACGGGDPELPKSQEALEKVAAPDGQSWTEIVSKTDAGGYLMGNPDAELKLVEYGAITCPGCAQFHMESKEELNEMVGTGVVSMEFRPYLVHGVQDGPGFLLAACNGPQTFFGLSDQMFTRQAQWLGRLQTLTDSERQTWAALQAGGLSKQTEMIQFLGTKMDLINFVKPLGVSEDAANSCLADKTAFETLVAQTQTATEKDKVRGTPAFRLNGSDMNAGNWRDVKLLLRNAGAR